MSNRAVVLRPGHALLSKPFPLAIALEDTPSPANFAQWKPGFGPTVPTFAIFTGFDQEKDEPGLVTSDAGFEDVPDAERILGGINMKGPDYASVARHGSFVMWGFHATPDRFTDAGRRLYLNALAYAASHKGAVVETLRLRPARVDTEHAFTLFMGLYPASERKRVLERHFTGEAIPDALVDDAEKRLAWFEERAPFLHPASDGTDWKTAYQLAVDAECRELGHSNASLAFLDALAARLAKDAGDALATKLLARYVPDAAPSEFGAWLAKHRDRLYFTEAGGWVWRVRGAPARSPSLRFEAGAPKDELVSVKAAATEAALELELRIRDGWHLYSVEGRAGKPVAVTIVAGSAFEAAGPPEFEEAEDGVLSGYATIRVPLRRVAKGELLSVDFTYTVCDAATCKPTRTVRLRR